VKPVDIVDQLRMCGDGIAKQAADTIEAHRFNARNAMIYLTKDNPDANDFDTAMRLIADIAGIEIPDFLSGPGISQWEFFRRCPVSEWPRDEGKATA
jgi:hypothetical protein